MPIKPLYQHPNFFGGINTNSSELEQKANEASYCNNCVISRDSYSGSLMKLKGNEIKLNIGEPVTAVKEISYPVGGNKIIAVGTTKICQIDSTLNSYTDISTGLTSNTDLSDIEGFENYGFVARGADNPKKISSGSAVTDVSGWPPTGITGCPQQIEVFNDRVIMSINPVRPYEAYYSQVKDPSIWYDTTTYGAGFFSIPSMKELMGQRVLGKDVLLFYTRDKIYGLTGKTPVDVEGSGSYYNLSEYACGLNFNAPWSIVTYPEGVQFFFNESNFYGIAASQKYGSLENQTIADKIANRLTTVNKDQLRKIFGLYVGDNYKQIWWWVPIDTSTYNNQLLIYDINTGGWWPAEGRKASCACTLQDGRILTGDEDGNIKLENVGYTYDGATYNMDYTTHWIDWKNFITISEARIKLVQWSNDTIYLDVFTDFDEVNYETFPITFDGTEAVWDGAVFDSGLFSTERIAQFVQHCLGTYSAVKLRFREATADNLAAGINIRSFELDRGR